VGERSMAELARPLVDALTGPGGPLGVRFWDGSRLGPEDAPARLVISSPRALRRLLWAPGELGAARAYVSGDADVEGDIFELLALRQRMGPAEQKLRIDLGPSSWLRLARLAWSAGALGPPPPPPPEEVRLRGRKHSKGRDARAISHHYDVSNEFFRLVLGESMTYSCAYFESPDYSLEQAQEAKHDLVCRKLGLEPGMRLLDVGCGWASMAMHAARHYGVRVVGVTISRQQAELARARVEEAGLADSVEVRLQDYRDVDDGPYDAISSIGMFEHVGLSRLGLYFRTVACLLRPGGRLLNHGISRPAAIPPISPKSFVSRYVFPDGELHEVGSVVSAIQAAGLEARDVESLREHYSRTLRFWVANLESNWERAVKLVGEGRARVWRLYMAASAMNFAANRTSVHQVLAVRTDGSGRSGMPATREELLAARQPA